MTALVNGSANRLRAELAAGLWGARSVAVRAYGTNLAAVQSAIDACAALGGGTVLCEPGATYTGGTLPVLKAGVLLDLQRATLRATAGAGNWYGLRVANYSGVRNGAIDVLAGGAPSAQFMFHTCVSIGEANSNGGTVAAPAPMVTVRGWYVGQLRCSTYRTHCPVVQGMGDIADGLIEDIEIPSSSTASGVHLDWSDVGSPVAAANIAGTRAAYDSGQCYTTHPHDIVIRNVTAGALTVPVAGDLQANLVRLSACYNITVEGALRADSISGAAYLHVGGDLGFEFAPPGVKPYACRGNRMLASVTLLQQAGTSPLIYVDTFADNIYREQTLTGYVPSMAARMHGDVIIDGAQLAGPNAAGSVGVRIIQARGVKVLRVGATRFEDGIWIDEFTADIDVEHCTTMGNRRHGMRVGTQELREATERVKVRACRSYGNGTATTGHGCVVNRLVDGSIEDCDFGTPDEATQAIGLMVSDNAVNRAIAVRRNMVHGATLAAYSAPGTSAPYFFDQISEWQGNEAALSCPQSPITVSQSWLPVRSQMFFSRRLREWISNVSGDPTSGHWTRGSRIWQSESLAASSVIKEVTRSGTIGTLSGVTASTTAASKVTTMTLAARTATAAAGAYVISVSSAAGLRPGVLVSVAGSVTNARILGISGTDVQLDKPCRAATAAALTCAGVIEGEILSLATTPAIDGATVMKVDGTTVTLDVAAQSSEAGRAVSYTAPVFKLHQVIAA